MGEIVKFPRRQRWTDGLAGAILVALGLALFSIAILR